MSKKEILLKELEFFPDEALSEIIHFVRFLKEQYLEKSREEEFEDIPASESPPTKDWLKPEEGEDWDEL